MAGMKSTPYNMCLSQTTAPPLVSIGIPVYNGERVLHHALVSVLNQTYQNLEVVICDNASTDDTQNICLTYAARDPRIRYYRNATNIGLHANFRRVCELSTGEYFTWVSADDRRPPLAIQACLEAFQQHPNAVMVHGPILYEAGEGASLVELSNAVDLSAPDSAERVRVFTQGLRFNEIVYGLYRSCALRKAMFPSTYGPDYLMALQMCLLGPVVSVATPIVVYHIRQPLADNPMYRDVPITLRFTKPGIPHFLDGNPMYRDVPITLTNLLMASGMRRWKCWTVLIMGSYYLLKIPGIPLRNRLRAIRAHVLSFCMRYRIKLVREWLFQPFGLVSAAAFFSWRLACRSSLSFRLASKLRAYLMRV